MLMSDDGHFQTSEGHRRLRNLFRQGEVIAVDVPNDIYRVQDGKLETGWLIALNGFVYEKGDDVVFALENGSDNHGVIFGYHPQAAATHRIKLGGGSFIQWDHEGRVHLHAGKHLTLTAPRIDENP